MKANTARAPRRSYPKRLSAFCNAQVLGIYKCNVCNWLHYGISERDALHYVTFMNEYTASLDDREAAGLFGGKSLSTDQFRKCFSCASAAGELVRIEPSGREPSVSGRPIIVPLRS